MESVVIEREGGGICWRKCERCLKGVDKMCPIYWTYVLYIVHICTVFRTYVLYLGQVMTIRAIFKECSIAKRIGVAELSRTTGISRNTITSFENGTTQIGLDKFELLIKGIECEIIIKNKTTWEQNF